MPSTDVVIIGGGQAGLAMSRQLGEFGIAHVVLERERAGERWRSERRASLRLLTPNWMTRLPGWRYAGPDPDGFMTMPEVAAFLDAYAASFNAPVEAGCAVRAVSPSLNGFRVETECGVWTARAVVVATGHCDRPAVPAMAGELATRFHQLSADAYRAPGELPSGGVLVVGGSASGVQIADELARAGRDVTISVGRHIRVPRRYRGHDIMTWLDRCGILDERADALPDLDAARRQPSLQLVGRPDNADIGLPELQARGVALVGRATGADGTRMFFADDLADTTAAAARKLDRLLDRIDSRAGLPQEHGIRNHPRLSNRPARADALDLGASRITSIIWATGYSRTYPWLRLPILDRRGEIIHRGGVTPVAGVYALGLPLMLRRKSSFIDGVGDDAREVGAHLASRLGAGRRAAA